MQYYDLGHFNKDDFILFGDKEKFWNLLESIIYIVPKDTIDDVRSNCVFLMIDTERLHGAGFIHKKLIREKSVIVFHDMLYSQNEDEQADRIVHEIAHYVLDHSDKGLSHEEYCKQEKEANSLKDRWVDDWEKHLKTQEE